MKKVFARFTGQNLSCGFLNGSLYLLAITHTKGGQIFVTSEGKLDVEYDSVIAFLNNWDEIEISK